MTDTAGHQVEGVGQAVPQDSAEYAWAASIVRAVARRSGLPTRWNGELFEELDPKGGVGRALDDGGMTLRVSAVLKPVSTAYTADRPLTENELIDVKDAVLTAVHEAKHLTQHLGDEGAPGAVPVYSADALALEEGLTERWALRHVDAVIQDIEMDRAVPGVLEARMLDAYSAYTAATDELIRGTADIAGVAPDQLRRQLEQADRAQRWAAIADLVVDQRLGDLVPPEQRDQVRTRLVQAMRPQFADLVSVQKSEVQTGQRSVQDGKVQTEEGKVDQGRQVAQRTVTALSTTLADLEDHYHDQHRQQAITQQPQQPGVDPGIADLRRFLGSQTPAYGATFRKGQGIGEAPDNVRQLRPRGSPGQAVE